MIFCVETTKSADTDSIYIFDTINYWYKVNNKIKLSKIYMNSKSKYNSKDVLREIKQKQKDFILGETKVIYCIDTDQYEKNPDHKRELEDIICYCTKNQYDLIWFCHNVEEVFLGKTVSDSKKVQEASAFRRKRTIEKLSVKNLSNNKKLACTSNILNILDKYLERKDFLAE